MYNRVKRTYNLTSLLLVLAIVLIFLMFPVPSHAAEKQSHEFTSHTSEIKKGWQYKWGDSPVDASGFPLWASEQGSESGWKPLSYPGQPSNPDHFKDVWLKVTMPEGHWADPALVFKTYEQDFEVYVAEKKVYSYGDIHAPDRNKRPGAPLAVIPLPDNFSNQPVYFRMHSTLSRNAGLVLSLEIGSHGDHVLKLLKLDLDKVIFAFLFIFIGLVAVALSLLRKADQSAFFSLGFSSIVLALWIIAQTNMKLLFYNSPSFWYYVIHCTNYLIPVGFLAYIGRIFAEGKLSRLINRVWQMQVVFTCTVFLLDISRITLMTNFIRFYFVCLILYILLGLFAVIRASARGGIETKIFFCGITTLCIFGINDFLSVYFLVLPWSRSFIQWGMFLFDLSLISILGMRFVETYDKLRIYSDEIQAKNKTLNQMWKEVKASRDKLAEWNENLEETVRQKTAEVKNILNNAGQGFLTFGEDLLIDEGCSSECEKIFQGSIAGRRFSELIFPEGEDRKYLDLMLVKILNEKNEFKKEIYLPLLPEERLIQNKNINISYKIIDDQQDSDAKIFMVILTDITDKRLLENKMENERIILKMVVKAVTNYNDFIKFIRDFERFCSIRVYEILKSGAPLQQIVFEIFRNIHTFKGSFSQMDMVNVVKELHDFESRLSELNSSLGDTTLEDFHQLIAGTNMCQWLDRDMETLKEVLGEQYFSHDKALTVDQTKLIAIEEKIRELLPPKEAQPILAAIRELRYRNFSELLKSYPQFVAKLSERVGKPMNPVEITGTDVLVDIEKYHDFSVSLVHVFRNIMDHGIETPEDRINSGKEEPGTILCQLDCIEGQISLMISDDGRGMDIEALREKAVQKDMLSREAAMAMNEQEVIDLIFRDGFSILDNVSELSGRGVGMAAVKHELEKIGGSILVKTRLGKGTEFHFRLPFMS